MMTQATFEGLLAALEAQAEKDRRNSRLMQQIVPEACGMLYNNALLHEAIKREMDDTETDPDGQSWTDYFIYELDYGRKNDDLKAYNADGSEIPLATAADLYRFLVAKQTDKHT